MNPTTTFILGVLTGVILSGILSGICLVTVKNLFMAFWLKELGSPPSKSNPASKMARTLSDLKRKRRPTPKKEKSEAPGDQRIMTLGTYFDNRYSEVKKES